MSLHAKGKREKSYLMAPSEHKFKRDIQTLIDEAYLGLGDTTALKLENVLLAEPNVDLDDPVLYFLHIMRQPENFYFTCKWLLNIDLLPFQVAILYKLWTHKFPMLIGSRGMGKSWILGLYAMLRGIFNQGSRTIVVGSAFRQSKIIFEYMTSIWKTAPVLQQICGNGKQSGPRLNIDRCEFFIGNSIITAIPVGDGCLSPYTSTTYGDRIGCVFEPSSNVWGNGKFRDIIAKHNNGIKPTKIITTKRGYSYEGTYNHQMKVLTKDLNIEWRRTDEMKIGDRILIDRSKRWHNSDFNCTEDQAFSLGIMIGDGSWVSPYYLRFATITGELAEALVKVDSGWKQQGDKVHWNRNGKKEKLAWLDFWKLKDKCYAPDKCLPDTILSASKSKMAACLRGLFSTDGTVQVNKAKGGTSIVVGFTSTSEKLVKQMQYILLHFGIISTVSSRSRSKKWHRSWELRINGQNIYIFAEEIGFGLKRKDKILHDGLEDKIRFVTNGDEVPFVREEMLKICDRYRGIVSYKDERVSYSKLQSRKTIVRDYIDLFIEKYGVTQDPFLDKLKELANPDIYYDEIQTIEDGESLTYDIEVPNGNEYCANGFFSHNSKIRGMRSNITIADEYSSISEQIFDVVIRGFGAVSESPVERVKSIAKIKRLSEMGHQEAADNIESGLGIGNQLMISGTAYYTFNHFYKFWRRYKAIIESRGDLKKLVDVFQGDIPIDFNWKDYCVIRIPYTIVPKGFLDESAISQAKATTSSIIFDMEYGAIFPSDSQGFFRRTLIESCTCKPHIDLPSGKISFSAYIAGSPNMKYVYGLDPASEHDNFAIVVLEVHPDHRRIVYTWTVTRSKLRERLSKTGGSDKGYYKYVAKKIRQLMKVFPTEHIGMDQQGGGIPVMEALKDIEPGELPILPYVKRGDTDPFWWEKADKPTDGEAGLHILHMVQFANAEFTNQANHGLRFDFESKATLFPYFDSLTLGESYNSDELHGREFDTLEDCVLEIEELKDELATIMHDQTSAGRDRWDTPQTGGLNMRKGRARKDRYTALVIANMVGRTMLQTTSEPDYKFAAGYVGKKMGKYEGDGKLYSGPDDIVSQMNKTVYGKGVSRR